eukprot:6491138-Amphidinium_carterae.1
MLEFTDGVSIHTLHALSTIALDCAWVSTIPALPWSTADMSLPSPLLDCGQCGTGLTISSPSECFSSKLLSAVRQQRKRGTSHRGGTRRSRMKRAEHFLLTCSTFNSRSLLEQGKILFVTRQLAARDLDVLCVQETRLRDVLQMDTVIEWLQALPIACRTFTRRRCHGPRVLRVSIRANGMLLHIISAHAPIEEDSEYAHQTFADFLVEAISKLEVGKVLIGCDLNAKLAGLELSLVGCAALSTCRWGAAHRIHLLRALDARGMKALNTMHSEPTDFTWRHANGTLSQIDFIMVDEVLVARVVRVYVEAWGIMDLSTTSDHRMVSVQFELGLKVNGPRQAAAIRRFRTEGHYAQFVSRVRAGSLPLWNLAEPAEVYITELMQKVCDLIEETAPVAAPRQPWISQCSWDLMCLLNKYRRLLGALVRGERLLAPFYPTEATEAIQGCREAIASIGKRIKRCLRADRRSWIDSKCQQLRLYGDSHDSRSLHRTVRQLCKSGASRAGRRMLAPDGSIAVDKTRLDGVWQDHWREHFNAMSSYPTDFEDRLTLVADEPITDVHPGMSVVDELPSGMDMSPGQVLQVIRRMHLYRATPDMVPSEVWRVIADLVAEPLSTFFSELVTRRVIPRSYAGCRIVGVWKRKGNPMSASNYRPVALMKTEAKLMSRMILMQLTKTLATHASQFGSGDCVGVIYPQMVIRQMAASAASNGLASCTLFVDIVAAFDRVLLPLLWGCNSRTGWQAAELLDDGFTAPQADMVVRFLAERPTLLSVCGLPAGLLAVLRVWGHASWWT